jgi:hypothetical protein
MTAAVVTAIAILILTLNPVLALVAGGMAYLVAGTDGSAPELGEVDTDGYME